MTSPANMKYIKTISNHCWHCGKSSSNFKKFKKCAGCLKVRYCSQDCQKSDWCAHKKVCGEISNGLECSICSRKTNKIIINIIDDIQQFICNNCAIDNNLNENLHCSQ